MKGNIQKMKLSLLLVVLIAIILLVLSIIRISPSVVKGEDSIFRESSGTSDNVLSYETTKAFSEKLLPTTSSSVSSLSYTSVSSVQTETQTVTVAKTDNQNNNNVEYVTQIAYVDENYSPIQEPYEIDENFYEQNYEEEYTQPAVTSEEVTSETVHDVTTETVITEQTETVTQEQPEEITAPTEPSEKAGLYMDKIEISYSDLDHENGTVVTAGYSVQGLDDSFCSTGIHITYDNRLKIKINETTKEPEYIRGNAGKYLNFSTSVCDMNSFPEIAESGLDMIFVATSFSDNSGINGDIAYFNFIVPPDAQPGDVYKLGFWVADTDMFAGQYHDYIMQDEVFSNLNEGYIMITD